MPEPLVGCILLTADRIEMTARAVRCFEAQTYKKKALFILDTGSIPVPLTRRQTGIYLPHVKESIGELRNRANDMAVSYIKPDLFAHWDSDDWSHPQRLAEQVALIESDPTLDAVGYSDMLFWDQTKCMIEVDPSKRGPDGEGALGTVKSVGEAWLYTSTSSYLLGTSLLYRRAAWERKPFEHVSQGEDRRWLAGVRTKGVRSTNTELYNPRMIASIHGSNTSSRIDPASENFKRVPEWDAFCRETMALPIPALK